MKSKLFFTIILAFLFHVSAVQAKCTEYLCVPIPERAANPDRDVFNGPIPAANIQVRLEGKRQKNKPTIVFVHGFGENISEWNCTQDVISKHYFTVAMDLRGYGKSTKTPAPFPPVVPPPPGEVNYSIQVFADDIQAVLTAIGVTDNLILVGHSLGAGIVLNYATTYPGVKKLVFVSGAPLYFADCSLPLPPCVVTTSPPPFPNCSSCDASCNSLYPPTAHLKNAVPLFCVYPKSLAFLEGLELFADECIGACPIGNTQCPIDCVLNIVVKPFFFNETCTNAALSVLQQNFATSLLIQLTNPITLNILNSTAVVATSQDQRNLLAQVNVPTLICYGSIDADVDPRNSVYMFQRIPKSILAQFLGKGHELNLTDVRNFNRLLAGFICGKHYPDQLTIGNSSCDVCESAFSSQDFTECQP